MTGSSSFFSVWKTIVKNLPPDHNMITTTVGKNITSHEMLSHVSKKMLQWRTVDGDVYISQYQDKTPAFLTCFLSCLGRNNIFFIGRNGFSIPHYYHEKEPKPLVIIKKDEVSNLRGIWWEDVNRFSNILSPMLSRRDICYTLPSWNTMPGIISMMTILQCGSTIALPTFSSRIYNYSTDHAFLHAGLIHPDVIFIDKSTVRRSLSLSSHMPQSMAKMLIFGEQLRMAVMVEDSDVDNKDIEKFQSVFVPITKIRISD